MGALLALALAGDLVSGRPLLGPLRGSPLTFIFLVLGAWLVFATTAYAILWAWRWTVEPEGISGRSYWGRRTLISWNDVGSVHATSIEGLPALGVRSLTSKRDVLLYVWGIDLASAHQQLQRYAGPRHVLTLAFAPPQPRSQRNI